MSSLPSDPTARQLLASDPNASVWVTASAGSGKTKVLTDRVLRLLLAGTPPSKILCITYTKAGAAEMRTRIEKRLGDWVMKEDSELEKELEALTGKGEKSLPRIMETARRLFAYVIEDPVGLRIQTIHSFCQSLLARFPIEAKVPPNFTLLEGEKAAGMLAEAKSMLAGGERSEEASTLNRAILKFARTGGEWKFDELLSSLVAHRKDFSIPLEMETLEADLKKIEPVIFAMHGVPPGITDELSLSSACQFSAEETAAMRQLCAWFAEGNATVKDRGKAIESFLALPKPSIQDMTSLAAVFLTKEERTIPKKQFSEALRNRYPLILPYFERIGGQCQNILQHINAFDTAERSYAVYVIAAYLYSLYAKLKRQHAALDYDDLIFKARELIAGDRALPWVMFKLDGGIEHVLVDEAQDTSRAQWDITASLVDDFFRGSGARESVRTLFVVGDPKQSIFRFQGAFPEGFSERLHYFTQLSESADTEFRHVPLTTSFRSSSAILHMVDAVFSTPEARSGLGEAYAEHQAFHAKAPGHVELWPLVVGDEKEKKTAWEIPSVTEIAQSGAKKLADKIADTIGEWLKEGRMIPATGQPIQPRDIMILSRRREKVASSLIQAFRDRGIPCSGLDRLKLTSHIAVKDMLALGAFLLLPGDDLSLASVLKSPLYGFSEETLMELAISRGKQSLWHCLQHYAGADSKVRFAHQELSELLAKTDFISPYALFADVLYARGGMRRMAARLGMHVTEVLEIFLSEALSYEEAAPPSLEEFCYLLSMSTQEWKSEQEQLANEVRILTVHGAKGLEAPVVFLVDSTSEPQLKENDKLVSIKGIPVMLPSDKEDTALTAELKETIRKEMAEEYRRLLYVALTRAKHELYITGVQPLKGRVSVTCWYGLAEAGMDRLPCSVDESGMKTYDVAGEPLRDSKERHPAPEMKELPAYMDQLPTAEPMHTIHNPSHMEEIAEIVPGWALTDGERNARRERGVLIHRLLEVLSSVSLPLREAVGKKIVGQHLPTLSAKEQDALVAQVLALMQHPDYADIFSSEALSEVPIAGMLEGRVISGQIDCLVITDDKIKVVDYKTGLWEKDKPVSKQYLNQMQTYAALLQEAYPGKIIQSYLLFTEGPELVELNLAS